MARRVGELVEDKALFSTFQILEDIQEKAETLPKGVIMRVRGMFAQADRVTQNGTLYKKSLWEREVERIKPNLEERSVLMLSDHPEKLPDGTVKSPSVKNVAGGLTNLQVLPDGKVMGEAEFADTEAGRNAAAIVRAGFKLGTSSRARGTFTEVQLEETNPLAAANPDYVGQKVKVVDENFQFRTFDLVVDQSVQGAKIDDFQEEETIPMALDISKLTEDEWKKVLDSDKVKALVEAKQKETEEAAKKTYEDKVRGEVVKMTEEFLKSDEFAAKFEAADEEEDDEEEDPKAKKAKKGKGKLANFGDKKANPFEGEAAEKFALLESQLAEVKAENQKLADEAAKIKERERVAAILDESLKGKGPFVTEKVRAEVAKRADDLTEEIARDFIKDRIDFVESVCKAAEAQAPAGKGLMLGGDREAPKAEDLTEAQKAVQAQLSMLTSL
jgi:hypothetical protein